MAVLAQRVLVSAAAVALNLANTGGHTMIVKNTDATNAVDLGNSSVAAGAGFPLAAGATVTVPLDAGDVLYAVRSAAVDVTLAVLLT